MDLDDPKRQFLEPGDTHETVVSLKWQWDLEPFTLSVIGANMDNHSFFERDVLWECLPDGWCDGVPVGGLSPRGLQADFNITEGPSERDIETMEVRAVSSADGNEFIDWVAGFWYENANHRRGGKIWWDTTDAQMIRGFQEEGNWIGGCPEVDVAGGEVFHNGYTINNQDEKSVYGELRFNLTEQWKLTTGYRRSRLSTNFTSSGDLGPCWFSDGPGGRASPWQDVSTVNDNLDLTAHLGWKESEILEDQRPNYVGLPLPGSTSGVQYAVLADWTQETALGVLSANATFRYVPERWGHFTKDYPAASYTMMDAAASLRRGSVNISLFLDNMFDDRAIVWPTPQYPGWPSRPGIDWRDQFVGYYAIVRPRTLALSVSVDM